MEASFSVLDHDRRTPGLGLQAMEHFDGAYPSGAETVALCQDPGSSACTCRSDPTARAPSATWTSSVRTGAVILGENEDDRRPARGAPRPSRPMPLNPRRECSQPWIVAPPGSMRRTEAEAAEAVSVAHSACGFSAARNSLAYSAAIRDRRIDRLRASASSRT